MGDLSDLEVYRKAMNLGSDVYDSVSKWPQLDRWTLGKQLMTAADSIAANIAEAYGRETPRERRRFLHIARGSARETECLLTKAAERNLVPAARAGSMLEETRGTGMMLTKLIASIHDLA